MNNERLCLERDGNRCRTCGSVNNLSAVKLIDRDGSVSFQLSNLITLCDVCKAERDNISKNQHQGRVGVLLCGGKGTRLYPLTITTNKHLLPIGICNMVFYPIKTLRKFGVKRVLIVVDQFASSIMNTLGSGKAFGMDFSYKVQDGAFGIADALYLAKDFINEETEEIITILGDNIFDNNELDTNISECFCSDKLGNPKHEACVYLKKVPNPEDYGIAVINDDGKIERIVEKPKEFIGDTAVLGLYVYRPSVFSIIEDITPSERGELEISSVNHKMAEQGLLDYRLVKGYWADCGGSIQRYAEASMFGAKQANVSAEEIDGFRSTVFDDK
jgi:glucose-1-phosphate thymidylyltransferase